MKRVHVLVLNYNGKAMMDECVPTLIAAVKKAKNPSRLTIIDNCSTDGSVAYNVHVNGGQVVIGALDERRAREMAGAIVNGAAWVQVN